MTPGADHLRTTGQYEQEWFDRLLAMKPKPRVYFIGWEGGPIKIGHAQDVRHRLHQIQVHCPYDVKILATRVGGRDLEAFYHRTFDEYRLRGEWFDRGYFLMREVGKLNGSVPGHGMLFPPRPKRPNPTGQPGQREERMM